MLLLDTHALVWWLADDPRLPAGVRQQIADPAQVIVVSAVSIWELAIKTRRGKIHGLEDYLLRHQDHHRDWGFETVPISSADGLSAGLLPIAHADPFDRLLIAQSQRLAARLVTADQAITAAHRAVYWA